MQLSPEQLDAIKELLNIGVGRAASILNEMTDCHVVLSVPEVRVTTSENDAASFSELGDERVSGVHLGFDGSFAGTAALMFPTGSVSKLVAVLTGEEVGTPDLDAVSAATLSELGNIVINGVMGSIANLLEQELTYGMPSYTEKTVDDLMHDATGTKTATLFARTQFGVEQLDLRGQIVLVFEIASFDTLLEAINRIAVE